MAGEPSSPFHIVSCVACLQAGQIIDDELNNWLVNPLPQGVVLHCIIDACHSGSVMDLPYRAKIKYGKPVWKNEYTAPTRSWKVCIAQRDVHVLGHHQVVACTMIHIHMYMSSVFPHWLPCAQSVCS